MSRWSLAGALISGLLGCSDSSPEPSPRPDAGTPTPVAPRAGIDAPATGVLEARIVLDGRASTPGGAQMAWRIVEAPGLGHLLLDAATPVATLVPRAIGTFVVELTVTAYDQTATVQATIEVGCRPPEVPPRVLDRDGFWPDRGPEGCVDYALPEGLVVRAASLVIEEGVEVEMGPDTEVRVESGPLTVQGDPVLGKVVFSTASGDAGSWGGLHLVDAQDVLLSGVRVIGAGGSGAAVWAEGASTVEIDGVEVVDALGFGVRLDDEANLAGWRNNTFDGTELGPASVALRHLGSMETEGDVHAGANPGAYEIRGARLDRSLTVQAASAPYRFVGAPGLDRVTLTATVLVRGGAVLELADGLGLELAFGQFAGQGSSDARVVVRGAEGPDRWNGVLVARGAEVLFEGTDIVGGGLRGRPWIPAAEPAALTVTAHDPATRAILRDVRILEPPSTSLWVEDRAGVEVRCEGLATSGRVVPDCLPPGG